MFKVCIMISDLMISNMMNSKKCVKKHGVKDLTIFVLIWLKEGDNGKYRIFNESKTTYIDCIPETEPF